MCKRNFHMIYVLVISIKCQFKEINDTVDEILKYRFKFKIRLCEFYMKERVNKLKRVHETCNIVYIFQGQNGL